ncbi:hypothetical protein EYF80_001393 [Liparis tanakae]|uniref:Uncharacterized protein n=1 Tax=Liparis tanakae TaxID=230148 RepID=A0A4Z2JDX1_9TELE|nr:hypothetical protein EYF80_001393 [Liparis tanakae]
MTRLTASSWRAFGTCALGQLGPTPEPCDPSVLPIPERRSLNTAADTRALPTPEPCNPSALRPTQAPRDPALRPTQAFRDPSALRPTPAPHDQVLSVQSPASVTPAPSPSRPVPVPLSPSRLVPAPQPPPPEAFLLSPVSQSPLVPKSLSTVPMLMGGGGVDSGSPWSDPKPVAGGDVGRQCTYVLGV